MPFMKSTWLADVRASLVVFLVALPLGLGIALASGFPPIAGMISGIIGGIIVGAISGSPLQVSGAAAGLTIVVLNGVQQLGFEKLAWAVALAGVLQILGGLAGLGRWFRAISPTVLQALLTGIGLLIVLSQIYMMFDQKAPGSGLQNFMNLPSLAMSLNDRHTFVAFLLGSVTIVLCVVAPRLPPAVRNVIPGPLLAIACASLIAFLGSQSIQMVSIPKDVWGQLQWLSLDQWRYALEGDVLLFALQLALIASAESLLCASAVDSLHTGPRTLFNRELLAQGVGNVLCGIVSCLPITGVIVRSSANIQAGALTRSSSILHGVWLLLAIVLMSDVLQMIPLAALAGLLVFTGCKLIQWKLPLKLLRTAPGEAFIFISSVALIVGYDLLLGVVWGCLLSACRLLWILTHLELKIETQSDAGQLQLSLRGAATYLRLPALAEALDSIPEGARVAICHRHLQLVDRSSKDLIHSWQRAYERKGGAVQVPDWSSVAHLDPLDGKSASPIKRV